MIRKLLIAAASFAVLSPAMAQEAAAPAAAKFSVQSTVGALLDNENAKAAFAKVFPDVVANPQLEQAREMTVRELADGYPDYFPAEKVKELDAALAKVE